MRKRLHPIFVAGIMGTLLLGSPALAAGPWGPKVKSSALPTSPAGSAPAPQAPAASELNTKTRSDPSQQPSDPAKPDPRLETFPNKPRAPQ